MLYEKNRLPNGNPPCLFSGKPVVAESDSPPHSSDSMIWDSFKKGDELAFAYIYDNYYIMLYQYGCKLSQDKELVRDCLQDFFLYLKKNRLGFGDTNSIKLYLLKAFRRRVIEYLRKEKRQVHVGEPAAFVQFGVESSSETIYINKQVKEEQMEKLNKALETLGRTEQEAIYYFYFKGLSYEQIAEIFKFSHVSSARRVMYRSLRQLRSFFSYS